MDKARAILAELQRRGLITMDSVQEQDLQHQYNPPGDGPAPAPGSAEDHAVVATG